MPRSPSDATRFTATGPYVANKPTANGSPTSFSSNPISAPAPNPSSTAQTSQGTRLKIGASAPANETPQQKIARLRKAAALARQGTETSFDRTVRIGRVWADRAHRFTAIGLIGLTVISGVVAVAGITDMLMHNRRRRNEWLAEQQMKASRDLAFAKRALAEGTATEDQILLINRERAAEEAAEAKKNRPSLLKRATGLLSGGLSEVEQKGGKLGAVVASQAEDASSRIQDAAQTVGAEAKGIAQQVQEAVGSNRWQAGVPSGAVGGALDQHAQAAADAATRTARSWTSWVSRGSDSSR